MKPKKYYALLKEFPFIEKTIRENEVGGLRNIEYCDYIRVQQANEILLGEIPQNYIAWDMINKWQKISFVLLDGTIIFDAVPCITASIRRSHINGENVTIISNPLAENIFNVIRDFKRPGEIEGEIQVVLQYLVWVEGGYNKIGLYSQPNFRATIYKFKYFKNSGLTDCYELMQLVHDANLESGNNIDICTLHR
jgi:hypothetical protein